MFAELVAAEGRLGPQEPIYGETKELEVEPGVVIETSTSRGSRRAGFEALRDLITKHRRAWATAYLED